MYNVYTELSFRKTNLHITFLINAWKRIDLVKIIWTEVSQGEKRRTHEPKLCIPYMMYHNNSMKLANFGMKNEMMVHLDMSTTDLGHAFMW